MAAMAAGPAQASDDKHWDKLWNMRKVGAESGWSVSKGRGMTIAIVDTGVDLKHEDLKDNLVAGYDFIDDDSVPMDDHGHGTHVAGIAAARVDNGLGVAGIAPEAKIMPVRALATDGYSEGDSVEQGIRWATDHGADVINLSLGAGVLVENIFGRALTDAVNYAWSKGVIPVVVTGNDNFFRTEFDDANAMVVTATTSDDRLAEYATGAGFAKWGIAAPGGSASGDTSEMVYSAIWSSSNRNVHYGYGAGTSMAAPHVSGAAAILRSLGFSPSEAVGRLLATAKDLGARGPDGSYGSGRLDVAAAVAGLGPPSTNEPATSPPAGAPQPPAPAAPAGNRNRSAETPRVTGSEATPTAKPEESVEPEVRRAQSADESKSEGRGVVAYLAIGAAVLASAVSIGYLRLRRS
jgi:serine protease